MTVKNGMGDNEQDEIINLMNALEPELKELDDVIMQMARLETPMKKELNHLRMMIKMNKLNQSNDKSLSNALILIKEINGFATFLDKLSDSPDEREPYIEHGFLEKCENIRDRFLAKMAELK